MEALGAACKAGGIAPMPRVLTTQDAVFQLLLLLGRRSIRRLYEPNRQRVLCQLLVSGGSSLIDQAKRNDSELVSPQTLSHLLRFLDTVRLECREEQLIRQAIDEHGNLLSEKQRSEDLLKLISDYAEFQGETQCYDRVGLLEEIQRELAVREEGDLNLPGRMLIYRPTQLFPLESQFYLQLAAKTELSVFLDAEASPYLETASGPANQFLDSVQKFIGVFEKRFSRVFIAEQKFPARKTLSEHIFNGVDADDEELRGSAGGVVVWTNPDIGSEVDRALAAIKTSTNSGASCLEDIQVFCFELDSYRAQLESKCRELGIPVVLRKGRSISDTQAGHFFRYLVDWLLVPSLDHARQLFLHPCTQAPELDTERISAFVNRHQEQLKDFFAGSKKKCVEEQLEDFLKGKSPKLETLFGYLARFGILTEDSSFEPELVSEEYFVVALEQLLRQAEKLNTGNRSGYIAAEEVLREQESLHSALAALVQFETWFLVHQRDFSGVAEPKEWAKLLRSTFRGLRKSLTSLRAEDEKTRISWRTRGAARSVRAIHRLLLASAEEYRLTQAEQEQGAESKTAFLLFCREYVEHALLDFEIPKEGSQNSLWISDFSEIAAFERRAAIVLGCTDEGLSKWIEEEQAQWSSELDEIRLALSSSYGPDSRLSRAYSSFTRLICDAAELVFSFPESSEKADLAPPGFISDLSRYCEPSDGELKVLKDGALKVHQKAPERALKLISARHQTFFTEYDAALGTHFKDKLSSIQDGRFYREGEVCFSVSALERFAANPFLFLVQDVFQFRAPELSLVQEAARRFGIVLHIALQRFFDPGRFDADRVSADFNSACSEMCDIAKTVFAEDELDWDAHPLLSSRKELALHGLKNPGTGKTGPLYTALLCQRDLLGSIPIFVEYRLQGAEQGFVLSDTDVHLRLSGVIDRVDGQKSSSGEVIQIDSIWDYKTGRAPSLSDVKHGRHLQVPLYAAALSKQFGLEQLPKRGGVIALGAGVGGPVLFDSPKHGPCRELLAIPNHGRSEKLDSALVEACAREAEQFALSFAREFLIGNFMQPSDSDLGYADSYGVLQNTDEVALACKWSDGETSEGSREVVVLKPAREFFKAPEQGAVPQLSEEQTLAVDLSKPICLSAGAGSGKTFVLQQRVLKLVLSGQPLESILALTFTEKAAEEMRQRIERALSQAINDQCVLGNKLTEEELQRCIDARAGISRMAVRTIHGLAASIIAMDEEHSGLDFSRIIESAEQQLLFEQAKEHYFSSTASFAGLRYLLDRGYWFSFITEGVETLARRPQLSKDVLFLSKEENRHLLRSKVSAEAARLRKRLAKEVLGFVEPWLRSLASLLSDPGVGKLLKVEGQHEAHQCLYRQVEALSLSIKEDSQSWAEEIAEVLQIAVDSGPLQKRKSKNIERNFIVDLRNSFSDFDKEAALLRADLQREEIAWDAAQTFAELGKAFRERYQAEKRKEGVVDFDDLIEAAHRMLCATDGKFLPWQKALLTRLRKQFRHIMVDEFQDTDDAQWDIISAIAGIDTKSSSLEAESIFIVGDRQQSIYSFRGGDSRVFDRAKRELERLDGAFLTLKDNYRSKPEVVDFVNRFFEKLFAVDFSGTKRLVDTAAEFQEMHAIQSIGEGGAGVSLLFSPAEKGAGRAQQRETDTITDFLSDLLEGADDNGLNANYPELMLKGCRTAQVAVLARTKTQLMRLAHSLDQAGIPFSISHSSSFYELEEISQLGLLLRAIASDGDEIAFGGVLRSAVGGASDTELLDVCIEINAKWSELSSGRVISVHKEIAEFCKSLQRWRRQNAYIKSSDLLAMIVEERGLLAAYTEAGRPDAAKNIARFIEVLCKAERSGACGLSALDAVKWFYQQQSSAVDAPRANSASHPVLLSTIHGVKGLEFPMVVLPYLKSQLRPEYGFCFAEFAKDETGIGGRGFLGLSVEDAREGYALKDSLTLSLLKTNAERFRSSEERRLFYVACTRAQKYLLLSLAGGKDFTSKQSEIDAMDEEQRREVAFSSPHPADWLRLFESDLIPKNTP